MFDFIEDACNALDLLSRFYRISYDKSKEVYNEDGVMVGDGITEELGWTDRDIYATVVKEDGSRYTFNDACEFLTEKYEEFPDIFSEENGRDGEYFVSLLESKFLNIDEIQRIALIKKIIRSSFNFFMPNSYPLYEAIQYDNTYGIFAYRNFMSDEEIEDYEQKDEMGMYKAFPIVAWLIDECCNFLYGVGTLCSDYNIDLQSVAETVFYTTSTDMSLRFDIFGDSIKSERNSECADKKEELIKKNGVTIKQKTSAIISLIRAAGFTSYDNTKMADFISWLTDGNSEYIRQKCITADINKKDAAILKKEFSMIGINYDVETHKIVKE